MPAARKNLRQYVTFETPMTPEWARRVNEVTLRVLWEGAQAGRPSASAIRILGPQVLRFKKESPDAR